ncbi:MAG: bifunctional fucokinase/L-fucose-1-P-guanylyltransferase [Lachnospiraceae bacterium]|nr:bifunctional fucokinase/L-fucose-1-P-guanylyltransferase [Lachnospiraceae bacterium]
MKTHNINYNKIKNLFLRQSYLDAWEDYRRSIQKANFIKWDYVVLTASNEEQARSFRMQIAHRLERHLLPGATKYVVLPDPEGKRVGSGGATFNVLKYLAEEAGCGEAAEDPGCRPGNLFAHKRVLVIHSGGDSKRIPQYSAVGKLFSPVPRELPDGRGSTLFDEFMIAMAGVPSRISEGMLVLSGDVLLLFNPLQIDAQFHGAAAISMKEPVETGKNHGVFLNDGKGNVKNFLHKQSEESLHSMGAVNEHGAVDLDTGAILLNAELLHALYGLISTEGKVDAKKFSAFVNDRARVSFYGDFLYPLASASTLEQYYQEKPEGEDTLELRECRRQIWEALSPFSLRLLCLSPARFIHFGTTKELLKLVTEEMQDYEFLDWKGQVVSTVRDSARYAAYNSYVGRRAQVGEGAYLENSYVLDESEVGAGSIVSGLKLRNVKVPAGVVLHGLPLKGGKYVARIYGVSDNPKEVVWKKGQNENLWNAPLYPVCDTMEEAAAWAVRLYEMEGEGNNTYDTEWLSCEKISLCESFQQADMEKVLDWQSDLENRIISRTFMDRLAEGVYYKEALKVFGQKGLTGEIYHTLMGDAKETDFSLKIRIYYAVSRLMKDENLRFDGQTYDYPEGLCFQTIQEAIYDVVVKKLPDSSLYRIAQDRVDVKLPVRVNWGGGWTDTPPHCNEQGGVVLNAAISLNGILPVQITVKKLPEYYVEFESQDIGVHGIVRSVEEIQNCHNPYDSFALHKAALIACGIIPLSGGEESLEEILERIGGGIYLSTQVVGIPKGSGLGTSSILAGACVKGIFAFLGIDKPVEELYGIVLCMEQIMSTGGGWQDQVGGLTGGIKLLTSAPGMDQQIQASQIQVPAKAMQELQDRFALIYTGQRRLARNLLRDVIGNYIGARPKSLAALQEMKPTAVLMAHYLERGEIDAFAELLNKHWELSKQLDAGSTNTCIDQIFLACEDLIDAKFIVGAGGGGFLMVILKKGVSKDALRTRLAAIFQDSGVDVWESQFV